MLYAAIDIYKRAFQAAVLDPESGEVVEERVSWIPPEDPTAPRSDAAAQGAGRGPPPLGSPPARLSAPRGLTLRGRTYSGPRGCAGRHRCGCPNMLVCTSTRCCR
jgi:hypothetical protein